MYFSRLKISEKDIMHTLRYIILACFSLSFLVVLADCGPATSSVQVQPTSTIDKNFQAQISPIPTTPPYLCGAWSSNNAPSPYSTITIYARLTKNIAGVSGATAIAVVHFQGGDQQLDAQPVSDPGGYVTFTLPLQGRQPGHIPATIDITFTNVPGSPDPVHCTQAFFTPL